MDISVPSWQNEARDQTGDIPGFTRVNATHSSFVGVSEHVQINVCINLYKCIPGHLEISFSAVAPIV